MPAPPASSASAQNTTDGRSRLSSAAPSATMPNTCGVNSAIAVRRLAHSQLRAVALAGDADRGLLDHLVAHEEAVGRARHAQATARQMAWRGVGR